MHINLCENVKVLDDPEQVTYFLIIYPRGLTAALGTRGMLSKILLAYIEYSLY